MVRVLLAGTCHDARQRSCREVTKMLYLALMLGIIGLITALSVPSLFRKKCPKCETRNGIEARTCKECGAPFPEE